MTFCSRRLHSVWGAIFTVAVALGGALSVGGCGDKPSEAGRARFVGRYFVVHPLRRLDVELAEVGDEVRVTQDGETVIGHRVGPNLVVGKKREGEADNRFELEMRGDQLVVRWQVTHPDGTKEDLPETLLARTPDSGAPTSERDERLAGTWRSLPPPPDGATRTKFTHLVLQLDGAYEIWQSFVDAPDEGEPQRVRGTWKTISGLLWLQREGDTTSGVGGWRDVGRVSLVDGRLVVESPDQKQVFEPAATPAPRPASEKR